jgi:hypothetical protein
MPQNPVTEPLNLTRDQILTRLWELANLNPELTRGIIAGQIKALAMIVAIEGLIPKPGHDRGPTPKPEIYQAEWLRKQQDEGAEPSDSVTAVETQPDPQPAPDAPSPDLDRNQASLAPRSSWVPAATGFTLDALLDSAGPFPRNRR